MSSQIPVVAAYYKQVRAYAVALYDALREKLENPSCKCPTAHETGLQLEVRRNETIKADTKLNTDLRFKCVFLLDWQQNEVPNLCGSVGTTYRCSHVVEDKC
jgi:hypothetical protein